MGSGAYSGTMMRGVGLKAGEDLSGTGKQFRFVKLDASGDVVLCTGATDIPIGVLLDLPESGEAAEVCVIGQCEVEADAAMNEGDLVGTSADGQADAKVAGTDTTEYVVGHVMSASAAAGTRCSVFVNCASPHRAA